MNKLIEVQYKIKMYEKINDCQDIKIMFILVLSIEMAYFLNTVYHNSLDNIILIIVIFQISIINYITNKHLLIEFLKLIIKFFNVNIIKRFKMAKL